MDKPMIYVSFSMTIRDGDSEYNTPYIASINADKLSNDLIEKTLIREVAMPELDIDPDGEEGEEYRIHEDNKIEALNGDYRWVWIYKDFKTMPKEHFEIMEKYGICPFYNLKPVDEKSNFIFT
jgi:hypothetical protein